MAAPLIRTSIDGHAAHIELNRPEAANRFDLPMLKQFIDALADVTESGAGVLIVTAAGADFSVGREQREALPPGMTRRESLALILDANRLLTGFPGISVTAIRGRALGFGSGLAVQSDLAVAADTAVLGFDEIRHGFAPLIVLTYLEHYVGPTHALDLVVTGRTIGAAEAERFGMVSRVVPADDLDAVAESLAAGLLEHDSTALSACKRFLREARFTEPAARGQVALDQMTGAP